MANCYDCNYEKKRQIKFRLSFFFEKEKERSTLTGTKKGVKQFGTTSSGFIIDILHFNSPGILLNFLEPFALCNAAIQSISSISDI